MWVYMCGYRKCVLDSTDWQNRMSRGCLAQRPYSRDTSKTQLSPSVLTLRIPVMCKAHASLWRKLSLKIPARTSSVFNSLSLHILSFYHTTLTIKSHNKYRVQKIEYNYNQIWYGIKANKIHICKSQLYNLPLWLFHDKTPITDSRLKREFRNSGKTHLHLI